MEGRKKGSFGGSDFRVEDDFKLPYGFGFDEIIQQKADLVNSMKVQNNKIMDELVVNLGYLDYRDCLAANKYILEAKRHGDYHQNARAKTLALAMSRMTQLKREQIEQRINEKAKGKKGQKVDRDEERLKIVAEEDPVYNHVYQAVYDEVKEIEEREMTKLKKLHADFDYYYNDEQMRDKLGTRWFDPKEIDYYEDLQFSTDFTDSEDDLAYRRYKLIQHETKQSLDFY